MLHFEQLRSDIGALGEHAVEQQRQQRAACEAALERLASAPPGAELLDRWPDAQEECALPATEAPLGRCFTAQGPPPPETTVTAVDGSQIMPDRHSPVLYYLIQVGGLIFRYNGTAPTPCREATLHYTEAELYDDRGQIIGRQLGMRRTVAEMTYLARLTGQARAEGASALQFALIDGPLLWPYKGHSEEEQQVLLPAYMAALDRLRENEALPAGFVERPGGRPLLNTLALLPAETGDEPLPPRLLVHMSDRVLMETHLAPGARTAWLKRPSRMNRYHAQRGHEIVFCYMNLGLEGYPVIARVEVPAWAISREEKSAALHTVLLHQARVLHGYPYALARAHEVALVTQEDKAALDHLLQRRLMEAGLPPARPSEKARQKAYLGRRR
ncbi:MAG: DNA double-strand break repair nuclease NurA [Anaerolineae bacterium]